MAFLSISDVNDWALQSGSYPYQFVNVISRGRDNSPSTRTMRTPIPNLKNGMEFGLTKDGCTLETYRYFLAPYRTQHPEGLYANVSLWVGNQLFRHCAWTVRMVNKNTRVLLEGDYHELSVDEGVAVIQRQWSSRRRPYVSTSKG